MVSDLVERARDAVRHGGFVVDVGAGIRPQTLVRADKTLCIEPYGPYADVLRGRGFEVLQTIAERGLLGVIKADTIVMLDVIEHMEKDEALRVLALAKAVASQVVVFTPLGFVEQTGDAWGMGGDVWQRHRSGWMPEEFADCRLLIDEHFHVRLKRGAFFAIWQRSA